MVKGCSLKNAVRYTAERYFGVITATILPQEIIRDGHEYIKCIGKILFRVRIIFRIHNKKHIFCKIGHKDIQI